MHNSQKRTSRLISGTVIILACLSAVTPVVMAGINEPPKKMDPTLEGKAGKYKASIIVNATPMHTWNILTNYQAMAGKMPDIKDVKLLGRAGTTARIQQTYQAPYTFGLQINATLEMQEVSPTQLIYRLIKGDQIRTLKGRWELTPLNGRTQLTHQIHIDPIVPNFVRPVYNELFEKNLRHSMAILKQMIEN